jgi:NAD+ synthetase
MKIAVAQINTTIGDFSGNKRKILNFLARAEKSGADMVVFPELAICGYPPRDLLEKPSFVQRNLECVEEIASKTRQTAVVLGYVALNESKTGRGLFNTAGLLFNGGVQFWQAKTLLPEYDVFDEKRHFEPAKTHRVFKFKGKNIALSLCEDLWAAYDFGGRQLYFQDPMRIFVGKGADLIINLSASPYTLKKQKIREGLVCGAAKRFRRPVIYCNLVGGNDELVFDGQSFAVDREGKIIVKGKSFSEDFFMVDFDNQGKIAKPKEMEDQEEIYEALVLGVRDYMRKCFFKKAVVGLSGGIDSTVVLAIACEAIGAKNVTAVTMPSRFTSRQSINDAREVAKNFNVKTSIIPIDSIYDAYRKTLKFKGSVDNVSLTEENIQARIRGNILMAISNKEGSLVLSTGNKSEVSAGYCTLYGDMAGGLAVISDVPKTMVYQIARFINQKKKLIPESILTKPPTAELKPDQTDQDTLPPYEELDAIIKAYIEDHLSAQSIIAMGFDKKTVEDVVRRIDFNEYKRRQAPPGLKVTSKAFGLGRRMPIAWKP